MDIQKILDGFPGSEESRECIYHVEIARHLEVSLGGTLSLENCMALMWILQYYEIRYSDGFVINGSDTDPGFYTLGGSSAATIASAFCIEMCSDGLRQAYRRDMKKEFTGKPAESLMATIRSDSAVVSASTS
jgi:hypothetical protein